MDRGLLWVIAAGEPSGFSLPVVITETTVQNAGRALPQSPSVGFAVVIAALLVWVGSAVVRRHDFGRGPVRDQSLGDDHGTAERPQPEGETAEPQTDAERVEGLLDANGGRLRQTAIVESTGWSKSKVSLLLTEMDEGGRIRKVRIGRENLVLLPGTEPDVVLGDADG